METIKLPDSYNGDTVECDVEPIEKDGDSYKMRVHGTQLIKWCTRQQWEDAMYEAYNNEMYAAYQKEIESGIAKEYADEVRRSEYQEWLNE